MSRKFILIVVAAGILSFAGAFATGWLSRPAAVQGADTPETGSPQDQAGTPASGSPPALTATMTSAENAAGARTLTEQQLEQLIFDVREKIGQYDDKLREVEQEKERLQIAQQTLQRDIEALNTLRVELAAGIADLKSERDLLRKTRIEVEQVEKANLVAIAAAYDKMDPISASEILTNMATAQPAGGKGNRMPNLEDAVKILHFMQDRTKANVLAEMVAVEPSLAALLSQKLKEVKEIR